MKANDSSSSATDPSEMAAVDLLASGWLPPLVREFEQQRQLDLLAPLQPQNSDLLAQVTSPAASRASLATALEEANRGYGHPRASELSAQLADAAAVVVITGQQPGLFGGPLYTLSKAVAAVLWAERLRATGREAVALFWVASEDHDFREASQASFLAPGALLEVDLGPEERPLVPLGLRTLGAGVTTALEQLRQGLPGDRFARWLDTLQDIYRPEEGFTAAFCRLMVELLGERCPLLVDAMLPALKEKQRPWMVRLIEQRQEVARSLAERDREIEGRGFSLQIRPDASAGPLFLLEGEQRRKVEWSSTGRVFLRGQPERELSVEELLSIAEAQPERVSVGVRARSAIQDAVFGTGLQVLGPAEMSYLAQVAPLYGIMGIAPPLLALRPQALVLEEHQLSKLAASGLGLESLLDPDLDIDAYLASDEDLDFLSAGEERLTSLLADLRASALELDRELEKPLEKTSQSMFRALEALRGRVHSAVGRRHDTARQRIETLRAICLPQGRFQERVVATAHFPGKYGDRFVQAMFEQMDTEATTLRVISP